MDTIQKILDKEQLKDIADQIVREDIVDIIVIYKDTKDGKLKWKTSTKDCSTMIGEMQIAENGMWDIINSLDFEDVEEV